MHKDFGLDDCVSIDVLYDWWVKRGRDKIVGRTGLDLFDLVKSLTVEVYKQGKIIGAFTKRYGLNLKALAEHDADLRKFLEADS